MEGSDGPGGDPGGPGGGSGGLGSGFTKALSVGVVVTWRLLIYREVFISRSLQESPGSKEGPLSGAPYMLEGAQGP